MIEIESEYLLIMDLPRLSKIDIEASYQNKRLTISGERKQDQKEETKNLLQRERYFGRFIHSFTLPDTIKDDDIKGSFKDGVLTVKIPKTEFQKHKMVQID